MKYGKKLLSCFLCVCLLITSHAALGSAVAGDESAPLSARQTASSMAA